MSCRNQAIETITRGIFTLEVFHDDDTDSPLSWGWPVELIKTRYLLEDEKARDIIENHGNIWFSRVPTAERGYTYIIAKKSDWIKAMKNRERDPEYYGWEATKDGMQKMVHTLAETYKQYIEGEVYLFSITVTETGEVKDSCAGFYGLDYCLSESKAILSKYVAEEEEAQAFEAFGMAL
jgi:hypothetical protein